MRETRKSVFFYLFNPLDNLEQTIQTVQVIDGGFSSFISKYSEYLKNNYGKTATIVFDGYPEESSEHGTKFAERFRRKNKYIAASVDFNENTTPTMQKEHFLANEGNTRRLIKMHIEKLEQHNFTVKQAVEDADTSIAMEAIQLDQQSERVIIVGEDIYMLVLLTAFAANPSTIYIFKSGNGHRAMFSIHD